jgi:uncharacterized MAPEG superfamily protein
MTLVILIIILALIEFIGFSMRVGWARGKFGVHAPATSGHPEFDKHFRVQQNTLEQLVVFVPALVCFAITAENVGWAGHNIGAFLGVVWLIGRFIYAMSYVRDPASRGLGFLLTFAPTAIMILGSLAAILTSLI